MLSTRHLSPHHWPTRLGPWLLVLLFCLFGPAHADGLLPLPTYKNVPAPNYGYGYQLNVPIIMSDGVVIRGDIWYPTAADGKAAKGPFPVLLQQTPYSKEVIPYGGSWSLTDVRTLVGQGYIVAITDMRGGGNSTGAYTLVSARDAQDGVELVHWASTLPNADGQVGLFGHSLMSWLANATAAAIGPHSPVKAVFDESPAVSIYRDLIMHGGLVDAQFDYTIAVGSIGGIGATAPFYGPLLDVLAHGDIPSISEAIRILAGALPLSINHLSSAYLSFLGPLIVRLNLGDKDLYADSAFWNERDIQAKLKNIVDNDIPTFVVGGWNDVHQRGLPLIYTGLQNAAVGRDIYAPMQPGQKTDPRFQLLMGPWGHLDFDASMMTNLQLRWFDAWLKGKHDDLVQTPTPLHLYVQGPADYSSDWTPTLAQQWFDTDIWPINGAQATRFYLGGGRTGTANGSSNDGSLSTAPPAAAAGLFGSDLMIWQAASLHICNRGFDQWFAGVPSTITGLIRLRWPCDIDDSDIQRGPSALTYTSAPFTQDKVLAGPLTASIYATANTVDTELVATVEMVDPQSGASRPISSGQLLGSWRAMDPAKTWLASNGDPIKPYYVQTKAAEQPVPLFKQVRYDIEIWPSAVRIPAGYRLRLTLATTDTPHLLPPAFKTPGLLGGVYSIARNTSGASFINVPLVDPAYFNKTCAPTVCGPIDAEPPFIGL